MIWVPVLAGLAFLAGAAYNLFGPEPDVTEAIGGLVLAGALVGVFFFLRIQQSRRREFLMWLATNAHAIERGAARFNGRVVTPDTELVNYEIALSFLIVSMRFATRPFFAEERRTGTMGVLCTAISLVLGWWGLPWGPVYTVQVVTRNVRGGRRERVRERLATLPASLRAAQPAPGIA